MNSPAPHVDENDLPGFFRAADTAARNAQREFFFWTGLMLALSVLAVVFGAVTIKSGSFDWAGLGTLVSLAGAAFAAFWLVQMNPHRRWYDGRALAESTKSVAWQYLVAGGDFGHGARSETEARADLVGRLSSMREQVAGATPLPVPGALEITPRMEQVRAADLTTRRTVYGLDRVADQEGFYTRKARENERWRKRWGFGAIALQAAGLIAAFLKMLGKLNVDLAGIAAIAAVAVSAWSRTKTHDELAEAYAVTAHEIAGFRALLNDAGGEEEWALYVANAETAFSREHTLWRARRRRL